MRKIGRYEIESEIGRGSMGVVYLAHDPHVRRRVAVKVFQLPQGLSSAQEREYNERFLREAQAAGALSHPAIVTIYDADADPERGLPYIAMEYVEGSSLRQLLTTNGRLETDQVFAMGEILAEALKVAHDAGVVHRDIKPANILVRSKDGAVKIADFGVARLATSDLTGVGDIFGSPAYMSPEQFRGAPVDARSDLFSLATILYQALCGERPFPGEDVSSIAYAVAHSLHPPASTRRSGLPHDLDLFFDRALAKDPAERFPDGSAFKSALADLRQGRPMSVAPPRRSPETPPAIRGSKTKVPVLKIGGRDVSALEGAFAIAMLLLALLPGLWVLRGVTSKPTSSSHIWDPGADGRAGPEGGTPDREGSRAAVSDRDVGPDGTEVPGGHAARGRAGRAGASSAERPKPWTATLGQAWTPGVRREGGTSPSKEETQREAEENGWALVPERASRSSETPGTGTAPREGASAPNTVRAGSSAQRAAGREAPAPSRPGRKEGLPTRGTSVAGKAAPGPGSPVSATSAAEGAQDTKALDPDVARLDAPVTPAEGSDGGAVLSIAARSAVKSGVLRIFVDGLEVYSRQLSIAPSEKGASLPKKAWYKRRQERFEARIEVSPGPHEIVAHVVPEGMAEGYRETKRVDVKPSETLKLELVAGRLIGSPLSLSTD